MSLSTPERWQALVRAALIGAARQPIGADFLGEAAELAVALRAGRLLPVVNSPAVPPAPDEVQPRTNGAQTRQLELILSAEPRLVPEWLGRCIRAGRRVDERLLPALLELGRTRPALRPPIASVLGRRGLWLAALETAWRWPLPLDDSLWSSGSRAERTSVLAEQRQRDPAAARRRLETGFGDESPEDRAELLTALRVGLSDADEPFLEAALDDRRKEVRLAAARLLYLLPRSRLGQRMATRATQLVRGARVVLPDAPDPAALRDGIESTPPRGEGARAFWLRQILAAAPLPPVAALAAVQGEWRDVVVVGWALAAARQKDPTWAEALLELTAQVPELIRILPPARREAVAISRLPDWELLRHVDGPWSDRLGRAALAAARAWLEADPRSRGPAARAVLLEIALNLPEVALAPLIAALASPNGSLWSAALGATLPILERRRAMQRAFQETAHAS